MKRINSIFFAVFLFLLNVFVWQEVFALNTPKYLMVDFLNVGQGDSAFVETPQGHQIMIDGGPNSVVLAKLAFLMPFWDKDLDLIILTHPEKDHMQGLLEVLKNYRADYILWSGIKKDGQDYEKWLAVLEHQKKLGAKIIVAESSEIITAGDLKIDVLYPFLSLENKEVKSANETSVVAKIIYGKNYFLFTGDIDMAIERKIVKSGQNVNADVLKIAHHGSKYSTSPEFLQSVSPFLAVISVGKNSYGHPTSEVLNKLENFGIKVKRTDIAGDIKLMSDGNKIYSQ